MKSKNKGKENMIKKSNVFFEKCREVLHTGDAEAIKSFRESYLGSDPNDIKKLDNFDAMAILLNKRGVYLINALNNFSQVHKAIEALDSDLTDEAVKDMLKKVKSDNKTFYSLAKPGHLPMHYIPLSDMTEEPISIIDDVSVIYMSLIPGIGKNVHHVIISEAFRDPDADNETEIPDRIFTLRGDVDDKHLIYCMGDFKILIAKTEKVGC